MGRHSLSNGTRERYRGCTRCVCRSRDDRIASLLERNYRRTVMLTLPSMTSIRINTQNRADSESHSRVDSDHFRQRKQVSFCGNQVSPRFGSRGKGLSVRCPLDSSQGAGLNVSNGVHRCVLRQACVARTVVLTRVPCACAHDLCPGRHSKHLQHEACMHNRKKWPDLECMRRALLVVSSCECARVPRALLDVSTFCVRL